MKNKGEIVFKVVGKERRYGSNVTAFEYNKGMTLDEIFRVYPSLKKIKPYIKKYDKGKLVKAKSGSVGILCFSNFMDAEYFRGIVSDLKTPSVIIRVKGFGKRVGNFRVRCGGVNLFNFLDDTKEYFDPRNDYTGIIAFDSVRVLE